MAKYIATADIPPNVKAGDIVEVNQKLIPEFAKVLVPAPAEEQTEPTEPIDDGKTIITNPDRNALKARATELEINFASNIPTERLLELVKEAEERVAEEAKAEGAGGTEMTEDAPSEE